MLKKGLLILIFLNFNKLLISSEKEISKSEKSQIEGERPIKKHKKELDFFVLRFQADNEQEANIINDLLKGNYIGQTRESTRLFIKRLSKTIGLKYVHFNFGEARNINLNNDFIKSSIGITFRVANYKDYIEEFNIKPENFIANNDIFIPMPKGYNCVRVCFEILNNECRRERSVEKIFIIKPGKKYIVKFLNFSSEISENDVQIDIQDIQENQLKIANELNGVLEFVPIDVNNIISEYLV